MKVIRGGDIRQFKLNGKEFDVPSGTAISVTPQGLTNTYSASGNGNVSGTQVRIPAKLSGVQVSIDNSNDDYNFLCDIRDKGEFVPVTITLADGTAWNGTLGIQGDLTYASDTGIAAFEMAGSKLEQI